MFYVNSSTNIRIIHVQREIIRDNLINNLPIYQCANGECKISISMTEGGNPKDNAVAERVNNTIKNAS